MLHVKPLGRGRGHAPEVAVVFLLNVAEPVGRGWTGASLVARCLGAFRLEGGSGSQFTIRTRKARALLAVLAVQRRAMPRESLADLLWSDREAAQARSSLRQTIFEIQHADPSRGRLLVAAREDLSVSCEVIVTDLELIRTASSSEDWPQLLTLLETSDAGLLIDLDGLDREMDDWLRLQRAQEPAKTLATAVSAAERCATEAGPRAGLDLISEVLRLDPGNEEATRLAMRFAHELGDRVGLHRHFTALRDRLREEYAAEPSPETMELLGRLANANVRPAESARGVEEPVLGASSPKRLQVFAAAVLAALALVAAGWWLTRPGASTLQTVVVVLPFDHQPRDQSYLAAGLWEQTRAALTRNSAIRVLGRTTTAAMAEQKLAPDQYLKRFGVTHILEGSVRRSGRDLLVSVSLTRTSDGVIVWENAFRGRMGEPFALEDAIANGIEGKLRARLAPGGGRRAEQIATTPEVYALYSEARDLISTRQRLNFQRAEALLREAVKKDPNYAPAWSLLGAAIIFNGRIAIVDAKARAEGLAYVKRALSMAPNFAPANATLALVEGDASKEAEAPLRRAVALDPSYSEAWLWLGNSLATQGRPLEARASYRHALELDPLLSPAIYNLYGIADELGDKSTKAWVWKQVARAGASPETFYGLKAQDAYLTGDYSAGLKLLRNHGLDAGGKPAPLLWGFWFDLLTAAGYYNQLHGITGCPHWYAPLLAGKTLPPKTFDGKPVTSEEFWTSSFFSTAASRAMINLGASRDLVRLYRTGFRNADDFISETDRQDMLPELAASLSVALSAEGSTDEASYLLAAASVREEQKISRFPNGRSDPARLAMVKAAQGDPDRALALLGRALAFGWHPDGRLIAIDLAQEPAFRGMRNDPRFRETRKRILDHIARERAELGPFKP